MEIMTINHQKLLQGHYEAERLPSDSSPERIVPDFAFNILHPLGLLYRPVVDEDYLENGGKKPTWPNGKPFAVCLTHDVDAVSLNSLKQSLRLRKAQLLNGTDVFQKVISLAGLGMDLARSGIYAKQRDPLHCYERWLKAEKECGPHATFFFWPGLSAVTKRHYTDCTYELCDSVVFDNQRCTVAEMIREIDRRGWEIGLHPSWYSSDDADELKRQKEALEKVLGHEIVSIRQHYLHYDIRETPAVHAEAGFKYDSTLGFNDNVGFRFGTSYPWYLYDLRSEKELPIMEVPLIIQDRAMLNPEKGIRLDADTAFQYVVQIAEEVEKVGGVLTLLWHTNWIMQEDWWRLYLRALDHLKQQNAFFASVSEIGEWWKKIQPLIDNPKKSSQHNECDP
jgi:peptidoglycan/xylan/chitin deacetylase (PgdA/CDA1 family)